MPVYFMGKERESTNFTAEDYKKAIRRYLESLGYVQDTDSFVEGNTDDMVFYNPTKAPGRQFRVSAKATIVNLNSKPVAREILGRLSIWLDNSEDKRFSFMMFFKKVSSKSHVKELFGEFISAKKIFDWIDTYKPNLSQREQEIINSHREEEILEFFKQSEVYVAEARVLESSADEKKKTCIQSPERYAKNLLDECSRRMKPIQKKCTITSNLIHLKVPTSLFVASTEYSDAKEVMKIASDFPPFEFKQEEEIASFCDINQWWIRKKIINSEPKQILLEVLERENPQFMIRLINIHLRRYYWKKGLKRYKNPNSFSSAIYYFPTNEQNGEILKVEMPSPEGMKVVTRPIYLDEIDKSKDHKLLFVEHHAVELSARKYWGKLYVEINSRFFFTSDGDTPLEGEERAKWDRKYRNPLFNRNSNKLSELRFWKFYLFDSDHFVREQEDWFSSFRFGDPEYFEFDWSPESSEKNQMRLSQYEVPLC